MNNGEIGMLWFDESKRSIGFKVQDAIKHFEAKYELYAEKIYLHPGFGDMTKIDGYKVEIDPHLHSPNYFIVGV